MAATPAQSLQRALDNYCRILVLVTEAIANPTAENVDAAVAAASTTNIMTPKPTYSAGGVNYDWTGYQSMLIQQITNLQKAVQAMAGPYQVESRGVV